MAAMVVSSRPPRRSATARYPFSRSLYIYVNTGKAAENPAVASFVDLYLSDDGLAKVSDAGYVDLAGRPDPGQQGRLGRRVGPPDERVPRITPTSPPLIREDHRHVLTVDDLQGNARRRARERTHAPGVPSRGRHSRW